MLISFKNIIDMVKKDNKKEENNISNDSDKSSTNYGYLKMLEDKKITDYIRKNYSKISKVKYMDFSDIYDADDLDLKRIDEIEQKGEEQLIEMQEAYNDAKEKNDYKEAISIYENVIYNE